MVHKIGDESGQQDSGRKMRDIVMHDSEFCTNGTFIKMNIYKLPASLFCRPIFIFCCIHYGITISTNLVRHGGAGQSLLSGVKGDLPTSLTKLFCFCEARALPQKPLQHCHTCGALPPPPWSTARGFHLFFQTRLKHRRLKLPLLSLPSPQPKLKEARNKNVCSWSDDNEKRRSPIPPNLPTC